MVRQTRSATRKSGRCVDNTNANETAARSSRKCKIQNGGSLYEGCDEEDNTTFQDSDFEVDNVPTNRQQTAATKRQSKRKLTENKPGENNTEKNGFGLFPQQVRAHLDLSEEESSEDELIDSCGIDNIAKQMLVTPSPPAVMKSSKVHDGRPTTKNDTVMADATLTPVPKSRSKKGRTTKDKYGSRNQSSNAVQKRPSGKLSQKLQQSTKTTLKSSNQIESHKENAPVESDIKVVDDIQFKQISVDPEVALNTDALIGINATHDVCNKMDGNALMRDSEDSQDEWEDVDERPAPVMDASPVKASTSRDGVEISVPASSRPDKNAKRRQQLLDAIKRVARKYKQEKAIELHKVHVLCLVARGFYLSRLCDNSTLQGVCLSLIPTTLTRVPLAKWNVGHTERAMNWFKQEVPPISELLQLCPVQERRMLTHLTQTHLLVVLLRALGFMARLVFSLQPVSWKIPIKTKVTKTKASPPRAGGATKRKRASNAGATSKQKATGKGPKKQVASSASSSKSPYFDASNAGGEAEAATQGPSSSTKRKHTSSHRSKDSPVAKLRRKQASLSYKDDATSDDSSDDASKRRCKSRRSKAGASPDDNAYHATTNDDEVQFRYAMNRRLVEAIDDDELFADSSKPMRNKKNKQRIPLTSAVSMVSFSSSESDNELAPVTHGEDQWIEVYLPAEKRWICIELATPSVDQPSQCERISLTPFQYVVGFEIDQSIKDVTCRYDPKWLSLTRRQRVDRAWWADVVDAYPPKNKKIDKAEDAQLQSRLLEQPLPKSVGEFKGHALFALERHLLKYEAIYPRTAATMGFIKGEAVYSRDCVHTLHSRENWMMEARVVKTGEEPYKVVKGRPKKNTPIHERDKLKLDIFGKWQTEVYKPPRAKNGIVPKNEYGNVELFKPCMLPPGTVHIPIQGIQKVARKLKIDAAPAMMGWDFHSGYCHPIIEGVIVCKEFKQQLLDAWEKEEEEIKRRAEQKREKKIYDRWRLIIKSVLVRERLKRRYTFEETQDG